MQEYGLLKRVFEGLHRYEHEDWAFYRFKVNQRRSKPRSWNKPWTKLAGFSDWLFLDQGCGYGTNPLRAVRAALIIVIGFGVIYASGVHLLHVETPPFDGPQDGMLNRVMIGALYECLGVHFRLRRHSRCRARLDEPAVDRRIALGHAPVGPFHRRVQPKGYPLSPMCEPPSTARADPGLVEHGVLDPFERRRPRTCLLRSWREPCPAAMKQL